jgi:hypothetical protein
MTLYSLKSMATPHVLWSNSLSFLIGGWPWVPYPEPFVKPLENFEMKKTLVAVAALVATGAFAQVKISGVIQKLDIHIARYRWRDCSDSTAIGRR